MRKALSVLTFIPQTLQFSVFRITALVPGTSVVLVGKDLQNEKGKRKLEASKRGN